MLNWIIVLYIFLGACYLSNQHQPTVQRHIIQIMAWPLWLLSDLFQILTQRKRK